MSHTHSIVSDVPLTTWKIEIPLGPHASLHTCGPSLNEVLAAGINVRYLTPYLAPDLKKSYREKVRHTIAHYIRAFRYPVEPAESTFGITDPLSLRTRLAYLYWVSIHTGPEDRKFTSLFIKMYDEYGKYRLEEKENE